MIKENDSAWLTVDEAVTALGGRRTRSTVHRWAEKSVVKSMKTPDGIIYVWGPDVLKALSVVNRGRPRSQPPALAAFAQWSRGREVSDEERSAYLAGWRGGAQANGT